MMTCPAQDGGLPKGIKYYVLSLACAWSGGDTLITIFFCFVLSLNEIELYILNRGTTLG
jgi:hypothetical protein